MDIYGNKLVNTIETKPLCASSSDLSNQFLCRLRSIAAHRDHLIRRLSVCACVCLSDSHTFLIVMHCYVSQATHAFLGMLPLCFTLMIKLKFRVLLLMKIQICKNLFSEKEMSPETVWVMSLSLKVLNKCLKSTIHCISEELFDSGFIQCLVYVASKGTEFSQQWLLKDLEVRSQQGDRIQPTVATEGSRGT